jgi:hypothetical protein
VQPTPAQGGYQTGVVAALRTDQHDPRMANVGPGQLHAHSFSHIWAGRTMPVVSV